MNYKHGLSGHSLRKLWSRIKTRCYNINSQKYEIYGARGIRVYEFWVKDFKAFYDYVTILPNYGIKGFTLDRINNDGNYEPGNLRWATKHDQTCNSRKRSDNKSGYKGVHFHKGVGKYMSGLRINGKYYRIGYFKDPKIAYEKRVEYIKEKGLLEYLD